MNTTTAANASTTRRQLTHAEIFKLCTWYKEYAERLLTLTDEKIIKEAEADLQITGLNKSHIIGVRRTLGIEKRRKPAPPSGDLAALEGLVNEQADQIVRLTNVTQNLLDRVRKLEAAGR